MEGFCELFVRGVEVEIWFMLDEYIAVAAGVVGVASNIEKLNPLILIY